MVNGINAVKEILEFLLLLHNTTNNENPFEISSDYINITNPLLSSIGSKQQMIGCYSFNEIKYGYYYPKYIVVLDNTIVKNIDTNSDINSIYELKNILIIPEDVNIFKNIKGVGFYIEDNNNVFGFDISYNGAKYFISSTIDLNNGEKKPIDYYNNNGLLKTYTMYIDGDKYVNRTGGSKNHKKKFNNLHNKTKKHKPTILKNTNPQY